MRVFVTAGEASGDRLGAALIRGLRTLVPDLELAGVGGALMAAEGLESLYPMEELSVMGLAEILPRYRSLKRRIAETADAAAALRPDVLVTIDSPDFSSRVARRVRASQATRIIHYVAPTVWAWRPGRARKLAPLVDHVLALLPFEPPYLEAAGVRCTFVGHPVVAEPAADPARVAALRAGTDGPLILVLPGSRASEVRRMLPVFGEVLRRVREVHPRMRALLPALPALRDEIEAQVGRWDEAPDLVDAADLDAKRTAFAASDAALTKSGTVSLELAAAGTPMIVAHDMAWISRQIIARMLLVDTVTLVNLISETRTVPEFLGRDCRPERIAPALLELLADPGAQAAALELTMKRLGRGGVDPGLRAARAVLDGLEADR
jgi:lipid-A-disaccharide synthase